MRRPPDWLKLAALLAGIICARTGWASTPLPACTDFSNDPPCSSANAGSTCADAGGQCLAMSCTTNAGANNDAGATILFVCATPPNVAPSVGCSCGVSSEGAIPLPVVLVVVGAAAALLVAGRRRWKTPR